jgi:hypothetical protein
MNQENNSPEQHGVSGGLLAALVVFALTWFVVNGAEMPSDDSGALNTKDLPLCAVPADIPTSRFLNAPVRTPVPWSGG